LGIGNEVGGTLFKKGSLNAKKPSEYDQRGMQGKGVGKWIPFGDGMCDIV